MEIVTTKAAVRQRRQAVRDAGSTVALVPTMGYLHEGHLSLVRRAAELADQVWVSIFVNPTQFGPEEDLDRYPRDLDGDCQKLAAAGVALVFAPSSDEMYPSPSVVQVGFSGLDRVLCGIDRPGHFAGVGLVVAKLLNLMSPEVAVFGQKDAQQVMLVERLVSDLDLPVTIEVAPTVREPDGLAMSSRNAYLSPQQRQAAPTLYRALCLARDAMLAGERDRRRIEQLLQQTVAEQPLLRLEYAECRSRRDLCHLDLLAGPVLVAIAARLGSTRLIDNLQLELAADP